MPDQATKRRVTQIHLDAIAADSGPVYGVRLMKSLRVGNGSMVQALPSRADLERTREHGDRVAAGYEVLLDHYRNEHELLRSLHLWFLQKSPEHYKGCVLCSEVERALSR